MVLLIWIALAPGASVSLAALGDDCAFSLVNTQITDNGDGDGFADTNETIEIGLSLELHCTGVVSDCVAKLSTEDPAIECIRRSEILLGDFPGIGPAITTAETFQIKIGSIDRGSLALGPDDTLEATLALNIECTGFNGQLPGEIKLPLDLNVSDLGQTPSAWREGFEGGGIVAGDPFLGTRFEAQNNDEGIPGNNNAEGLINGDGWRCQYSDPDWINSDSYQQSNAEDCYPGFDISHANAVFWQIDGAGISHSPDGGRAKAGTRSMYYGIFLDEPEDDFTTPLSMVEAAGSRTINLGVDSPRLSFWHQISLADHRMIQGAERRSADRGALQIQLLDEQGTETSPWTNLQGIQNGYASQNMDNFFNCSFDPVDDGNTEDDFFDATDPDRQLGPSSTCYPEWTWSWMGSTAGAFDVADVGNATTPPAASDQPALGDGTWVETIVDLGRFRGRRARLRFIVAGHQASTWNWFRQYGDNNEADDGWWIDEIEIDETLAEPAEFSNDGFLLGSCTGSGEPCIGQCRVSEAPCSDANPCDAGEGDCVVPCPPGQVCAGLPPDCGANCAEAQSHVFIEPDGPQDPASVTASYPSIGYCRWSEAPCSVIDPCVLGEGDCVFPDEGVSLNLRAPIDPRTGAAPSWVDACIDGYLEFRFCASGDPDGNGSGLPDADCDDAWDSPACDSCSSGWDPSFTRYLSPVVVTTYAAEVRCSSVPDCRNGRTLEVVVDCASGDPNTMGLRKIRALDKATLTWRGPLDVDWLRGSFSSSAEIGDYVEDFFDVASYATSIPMDGDPPVGTGYYYLVKADGPVSPFQVVYSCDSVTWRSGGQAETQEPARVFAFGDP
jgi:hypothetical protein